MLELLGNRLLCFAFGHKHWPIVCTVNADGDLLRTCVRCKRTG